MDTEKVIRVGSRRSELAVLQSRQVIKILKRNFPEQNFEIHTMSTVGDRVLNKSLPKIGEKSLFTRDLEDCLRNGGVDFIVHSLKDLPTALPEGLTIACVLRREDPCDVVVMKEGSNYKTLAELPEHSRIGTSSLRRTAQLRRTYKHLQVLDIRGNLNTRLSKLDANNKDYSAIVLAKAGLERMGWHNRVDEVLKAPQFLYAVGQGALAVECRANDDEVLNMLRSLVCVETTCCILAERSFLKTLGGGCSAPIGVSTSLSEVGKNKHLLRMRGAVFSLDGVECVADDTDCNVEVSFQDELEFSLVMSDLDDEEVETPVVNEEENTENIAKQYDINDLLGKHMQMLDGVKQTSSEKCPIDCPVPTEIGQDFMGECPFVAGEMKTAQTFCPFSGKKTVDVDVVKKSKDVVDESAAAATVSPFTRAKLKRKNITAKKDIKAQGDGFGAIGALGESKCPFRRVSAGDHNDVESKGVTLIYDYKDENKPPPSKRAKSSVDSLHCADFDQNMFCGLFGHSKFNLKAFERCCNLGMELAKNLICRGAADIIKCSQDTIHQQITTTTD